MNPWNIIGWTLIIVLVGLCLLILSICGWFWLKGVYDRWQDRRAWRKTRHAPLPAPGREALWKQRRGKLSILIRHYQGASGTSTYSIEWQNGTIWGGASPEDIRRWIDRYHLHHPESLNQ